MFAIVVLPAPMGPVRVPHFFFNEYSRIYFFSKLLWAYHPPTTFSSKKFYTNGGRRVVTPALISTDVPSVYTASGTHPHRPVKDEPDASLDGLSPANVKIIAGGAAHLPHRDVGSVYRDGRARRAVHGQLKKHVKAL
jgi:hypothetical protein